ncbi:MAG: hypothetical protein KJZ86_27890, partial [Caldilineaceae bacterium]|nr:hypothetical protein [Caldilineaceae bacterium]
PDTAKRRHYLLRAGEAARIEQAVQRVLAEGPRTQDLGGTAGTDEVTDAVIMRL